MGLIGAIGEPGPWDEAVIRTPDRRLRVFVSSTLGELAQERRARGGRLGDTIRSAFPALRARARGGDTILSGVLADQAALYGVRAQIEALGLELIEVRRLPPA